ncbi:hypothetical protein GCM10009730_51670 [Streptomyces albidochromogenes]|uniref:MarR family winged helix-turn-helix transcriptional regulator n=1 Tax=Streptomyces albidochromogenes TaxID=329524 RepID=UPI00110F8ECD|nr:MarR family transcriptional regulator [Streptomyces albidochromogenes]
MPQQLAGSLRSGTGEIVYSDASEHRPECSARAARGVVELLAVLGHQGLDPVSAASVSASQLRALYVLEHSRSINVRTLSDTLGLAPSSVSRLCDRLQRLGFVERIPSSASRREVELRLTNLGKSYLNDLRTRHEAALVEVISSMAPATRAALVEGLAGFRRAADGLAPGLQGLPSKERA